MSATPSPRFFDARFSKNVSDPEIAILGAADAGFQCPDDVAVSGLIVLALAAHAETGAVSATFLEVPVRPSSIFGGVRSGVSSSRCAAE
jgi:hypothetical protein